MNTSDVNLSLPEINLDYNQSSYTDYGTINYLACLYGNIILQKTSIALCSIIFVPGIIGNGLVIWIAGFRMKRTISAIWFLNLAIADILCCASLPLRIVDWVYYNLTPGIVCLLNIFLFNLNMSASVFLLTAMSIDRCVSIMWPFWAKFHRTFKLVRITAAFIWVLSFLLTGLVFYSYRFHAYDLTEWCIYCLPDVHRVSFHKMKQTIQRIRLFIWFVIPFLIILISYVTIFFKLRKSKRPQRSQRPYRIITAVILCFFICWSPYYIWPLTPMYGNDIQFNTAYITVINLAYLNSCINPIIYVFMGQDFKHSFLRSIPFRLERALSEHPNDLYREREDLEPARTTGA